MTEPQTFASTFDAIADTPEQSANLQGRAKLMQQVAGRIQANDWTQAQAAVAWGTVQSRTNDLLLGWVSKFSLDALVNIVTALGGRVHVILEAA